MREPTKIRFWTDKSSTNKPQAVNENGETFIDDVTAGDVWFFLTKVPIVKD
jgi:hypothetical protein